MKALAPGSIVFHPHRGYGVLTAVNLLTGWVGARFGNEVHALDLSLSEAELQHADGEPIRFRRAAPAYMPHARLMEMVRYLHGEGYGRLYLYVWPKPSGLHWRWQLFSGQRMGTGFWVHRPLRAGWHGSGSEYIFNPVMGWGDAPGATARDLALALQAFDAEGLESARGADPEYAEWFATVCAALLPHHAFSLGWEPMGGSRSAARHQMPLHLPTMAVRRGVGSYTGAPLPWPPGWLDAWVHQGYQRRLWPAIV